MRVTLKQISEEAGVSMTTVSNVINHKTTKVSQETADLVRAVIKKYNYVPNLTARSLATNSSRLIGVLYNNIDLDLKFSDPFIGEFLDGFSREATENNFYTFIHQMTSIEDIEELQKQWLFAGFVGVGFSGPRALELTEKVNHPVVFVDTYFENEEDLECYVVRTNDYQAGYDATQYLMANEHQHIGFLGYSFALDVPGVIQKRYEGYQKAIADTFGESARAANTPVYDELEFETIKKAIKAKEITALVVSADNLAIRLISYLKLADAYHDVSIISFDNIELASIIDPPLTTISLFQSEKGEQALKVLAETIDDKTVPLRITHIEGLLVERKTVHPLNNNEL